MSLEQSLKTNDPNIIRAPFTQEQVDTINLYQTECTIAPQFTCAGKIHEQSSPDLIAKQSGLECPDKTCDFTQNWVHAFMADIHFVQSQIDILRKMYPFSPTEQA